MRREDRKIGIEEAKSILDKGEYGVLSMTSTESGGYGIPVSYVFCGDRIYFHSAKEGTKLDYLMKNSKVSFCVVGKTEVLPSKFGTIYESVIVSGFTTEVDGDEKYEGLVRLLAKYSSEFMPEGKAYIENAINKLLVIKLVIESITDKARKK